ncbi:hypothetical protein LTR10_017387 [Elasticomyces elasticus]|uniref:Mitochondrial adapter protein MCP1 transmembrane domain-containing protein n=1 Tax=Exophiala sideris TaxID=1016849 RepID=A0ABR0J914_9EURO|nr:hypothetical protein LTR10_017387 [Elasticomyces elasticus]KAK5037554.1 hypothetical protein LTR13_004712 [Exophiala sideris]KAK5059215.1 hypothetical protein LTR69_006505 [Exophiala sideris]
MSSQPAEGLAPLSTSDTRSSISAAPMHEVEPSPVDEEEPPTYPTNPSDIDPEKLPVSDSTHNTTNFLGLTPARTLHILSVVQKYATLPPTIYLAMHYTNTAIIPLVTRNVAESDKYLLLTRPYYQSFPIEPLMIFAPILTHVISGVALRVYRRRIIALRHGAETRADRKKVPWPKVSLTSALGYAMYPMFVAHVLMQRVIPKQVDGSSAGVGLRYFAHGMAHDPITANTFYTLFVTIASFHFIGGTAKYLKLSREYITEGGQSGAVRRKWRGRIINALAATVAAVWLAGGLGVVGRAGPGSGWEASNWNKIYGAVPLIGKFFR